VPDRDLEDDYRDRPTRPPVNPAPAILALAGAGLFLIGAIVVCGMMLMPTSSQSTLKAPTAAPAAVPDPGAPEVGPMPREVRPDT
jgi:hypothetical protein